MTKTAVVLFNLGGPDSLGAVERFLFNLFNDKAIIGVPQPLRFLIATIISLSRSAKAKKIYAQIGGKSPILKNTQEQADALERVLQQRGEYKTFIAMRYWNPMTKETVADVKAYNPDKVILLPLYPQFSTTTTQSSLDAWYKQAKKARLNVPHHSICCYPFDDHFVNAYANLIKPIYAKAALYGREANARILFSAHGLPKKIVNKGDPYQWQTERTAAAIMRKLGDLDHVVCYQSRVGPLEWIGPSTEEEIIRAGKERMPVVVVPLTFVSEHSETLVELDIDYKNLASEHKVPHYARVPTVGTHPEFIETLSWLCEATKLYPNCSNALGRQCPKEHGKCGYREW